MAAVAVGFTKAVLRVSAAGQRSAGVGGLRPRRLSLQILSPSLASDSVRAVQYAVRCHRQRRRETLGQSAPA